MKIEQRIGRIDRIGQKAQTINIWNIFCKDTLDERVYRRLFERLEIFKEALGSIESVLGDEITKMTYDLLSHSLTEEQENDMIEQTSLALERIHMQQNTLEEQAVNLVAHGQYIQEKVRAANELHRYISNEDLLVYFKDFFTKKYPGCEIIQQDTEKLLFNIRLSSNARVDLQEYLDSIGQHGKTSLTQIDTSRRQSFLFENRLMKPPVGIEVISQYHPVVRFISHTLKHHNSLKPHPVATVKMDRHKLDFDIQPGLYVFAVQLWNFLGAKDLESLAFKVIPLADTNNPLTDEQSELLVTTSTFQGEHWFEAKHHAGLNMLSDTFHDCIDSLINGFEAKKALISLENEDRINFQIDVLKQHQTNQINKINQRIISLVEQSKNKIIPAEMGKIKKINERVSDKINHLEKRRIISSNYSFVTGGIILVQ